MIIMGVDPGLTSTGYGVIKKRGDELRALGYGSITTSPKEALSSRLAKIYREIKELIEEYRPDLVVIEELFFNSNARSAMVVGEARGGVILAAAHCGVGVEEYTPLQVKQALVGHGRAEKRQVSYMVRTLLSLEEEVASTHASDALALAICHAHREKLQGKLDEVSRKGPREGRRGAAKEG